MHSIQLQKLSFSMSSLLVFAAAPETNVLLVLRGCLGLIALTWGSFVWIFLTGSLSCHASALLEHTSMLPRSTEALFGTVILRLLPVVI